LFFIWSLIFFDCICHPIVAAPPNPYRFYEFHPLTNRLRPRQDADLGQFANALQGCCLARAQSILQSDGVEYVLAIKIDFADQPGQRPGGEFDQYLFGETGVSLKTYYREVSYGKMDVQPGPMGAAIPQGNRWFRAKQPMGYYGAGRIPIDRYIELVREACAAADATVDFSQYDRNKDGVVDHIFVIHSGDDEASTFTGVYGDNIWSVLTPGVNAFFDGVRVDTAVVVAEEPSFKQPHLGIYFHEFFHDFGAPDVYGSPFTDARDQKWDLMGAFGPYQGEIVNGVGDGTRPSHMMGYLKWDFDARPENGRLGWIEPVEITKNVSNLPIPSFAFPPGDNKLFKIGIPGKTNAAGESVEFFLVENRYRESGGLFDTRLPESGILIWHIDETRVRPSFSIDAAEQIWLEDPNDPDHEGVDPNNPDIIDPRFITDGAAYSADDGQTSFTPATRPNSNANDGTVSGIAITNIGLEGPDTPISVSFGDTYEPNDELAQAFPIALGETYESFLFDERDARDAYRLEAVFGNAVVVTLIDLPEGLDYQVWLLDEDGRKLAEGEEVTPNERRIVYKPERTGTLFIVVESRFGFSEVDSYRLIVNAVQIGSGALQLAQVRVFPNPFRTEHAEAVFAYTIPDLQLADAVELEIFNIAGDLVYRDVRREVIGASRFRWDGKSIDGTMLASGVYIYVLSATQGGETVREVGKMGIVR
jgi:M6 family metalloprotease-like protein